MCSLSPPVDVAPSAMSNPLFLPQTHLSPRSCVSLCILSSCRAAVHGIPSLPSLDSQTRLPSFPLPPLNPWRPCQKPTSLSGSTGWTDFARVCLCLALPARISYGLQVKIWSNTGRPCHNRRVKLNTDLQFFFLYFAMGWFEPLSQQSVGEIIKI